MRRLVLAAVLAGAAAVLPGAASAAECTYAGSDGIADVRVCVRSTCADLCYTYIEPSCTGLPVDCAIFSIGIGPY